MLRTLAVAALLVAPVLAGSPGGQYVPTDAERARWTIKDMNDWAIVLRAYHKDNNHYPEAAGIDELIAEVQPVYIRVAPSRDAWGNAYSYKAIEGGRGCSLASAGSDGQFEPIQIEESARLANFADDAIVRDGKLLRGWEFR